MAKRNNRMLCLTFPPDLIQYLDGLAWDILRKSGSQRKLDRMDLLRSLVLVFREGRFDITGIKTEDEFVQAVLMQIRKHRPNNRSGRNNGT